MSVNMSLSEERKRYEDRKKFLEEKLEIGTVESIRRAHHGE